MADMLVVTVLILLIMPVSAEPDGSHGVPCTSYRAVNVVGQPKSGTSITELIVEYLLKAGCEVLPGCETTYKLDGNGRAEISAAWTCDNSAVGLSEVVNSTSRVDLRTMSKHTLPVRDPELRRRMPASLPPQGIGPLHGCFREHDSLNECVAAWEPTHVANSGDTNAFILVLRDPRDVVISAFFYKHGGYDYASKELADYTESHFLSTAAWTAARWQWFTTHYRDQTHVVCYDDLVNNPMEHARGILSLLQPFDAWVDDDGVAQVVDTVFKGALLERERGATAFEGMPNGAKYREGGSGYYHVLSEDLVGWMNSTLMHILPEGLRMSCGWSFDSKAHI